MCMSAYLLRLPPFVLLLLMMLSFAAVGAAATYLFRRFVQKIPKKQHNEVMGHFFGLLGGIYGLLLGFVVVLVWGAYNDTEANAAKEESLALSLYREITYFPDSAKAAPLRQAYMAFVRSVVEKEYPQMEAMQPFTLENSKCISRVYKQLEELNKEDARSEKMAEHLSQLAMYRSLREMGAYADIPLAIWLPLLLGYLVLIASALFLGMESIRLHVLANGLSSAFVGLVIYIILLFTHPFTGSIKIEPEKYKRILELDSNRL